MSVKLVVDASVALKWLFDDEEDLVPARELLGQFHRGEAELVVPGHWPLEVLNGIKAGILKKRIESARAQTLADDFVDLGIATTDVTSYATEIYRTAVDLDRTAYDAAYIVLAEKTGLELWTGDKKLFNAVKTRKPFVRYVGEITRPKGTE